MRTLLVIGGTGLLGSKVVTQARGPYQVTATHRALLPEAEGVQAVELHKERREEAARVVETVNPDVVVDTAAFHDVDGCEADRDRARAVNVDGTTALVRATNDMGARYAYISTDFVFDGARGPYGEGDAPDPVNFYGETKRMAEKAVLRSGVNLVIRPSVVYGWDDTRLNFATWVLTSLREGQEIQAVTDWAGSPTLADSLAEAILQVIDLDEGGIYHLAGPDCMSRYDFARRLARGFDLDVDLIRPVKGADLGVTATRPLNSCLRNARAAERGITTVGVGDGIRWMEADRSLDDFVTPTRFKS